MLWNHSLQKNVLALLCSWNGIGSVGHQIYVMCKIPNNNFHFGVAYISVQ